FLVYVSAVCLWSVARKQTCFRPTGNFLSITLSITQSSSGRNHRRINRRTRAVLYLGLRLGLSIRDLSGREFSVCVLVHLSVIRVFSGVLRETDVDSGSVLLKAALWVKQVPLLPYRQLFT
ncbi:hypothetical protein AOLI_G00211930, partial [Acnodon oligacanthus]